MTCKRCGSPNVKFSFVAEQKRTSTLEILFWLVLAFFTYGLVLLIPLLAKSGSKTEKYAVCQDCGHSWKCW